MSEPNRHVVEWSKDPDRLRDSYTISCETSDLFRQHADKIWRYPPLIQKIVDKCQTIFLSGCFHLSWLEIEFREHGPLFAVTGDGCWLACSKDGGYFDHNVDRPDQAFCLCLCLQAALVEIDWFLSYLEDGHELKLDEAPQNPPRFRFTRDLDTWGLYYAVELPDDKSHPARMGYVWARGLDGARKAIADCGCFSDRQTPPFPVMAGPPIVLAEIATLDDASEEERG